MTDDRIAKLEEAVGKIAVQMTTLVCDFANRLAPYDAQEAVARKQAAREMARIAAEFKQTGNQ